MRKAGRNIMNKETPVMVSSCPSCGYNSPATQQEIMVVFQILLVVFLLTGLFIAAIVAFV